MLVVLVLSILFIARFSNNKSDSVVTDPAQARGDPSRRRFFQEEKKRSRSKELKYSYFWLIFDRSQVFLII